MTDASLAIQKALRARLIGTDAVTALVPADAILARSGRPEVFPCILIGEGQTVYDGGISRNRAVIYDDIHLWENGYGLANVKAIAGTIRKAVEPSGWTAEGWQIVDATVTQTRFMHDPDGIHSHGIVTVRAILSEITT